MVAAAVVEVQMRVDDEVDAGHVEVGLGAQGNQAGVHVGYRRVQLRQAGVDEHAPVGVVDDVHVDRHPLALGQQLSHEDRRDALRRNLTSRSVAVSASRIIRNVVMGPHICSSSPVIPSSTSTETTPQGSQVTGLSWSMARVRGAGWPRASNWTPEATCDPWGRRGPGHW